MSNSQSAAQDDRAAQSAKRRKRKERTAKARTPEPKDIVSGAGQPLDASVRRDLEEQLGHDFSRVRLHTDRDAGHLTEMLGADAVAVGQDIFFREGTYAPGTADGQRLLAHELLHTVQNPYGAGPLAAGRDLGAVSLPQEAAEQEAESTARRLMRQETTAEAPEASQPVEVQKGEVTPAWMRYATVNAERMRAEKLDPAGLVERLVGGVLRSLRGDPADASQRVRTELARMAPELQDSVLDRLEVRLSSPEYGRLLDLVDEVEQGGPQLLPMDGALAPEAIPDTIDQVEQERERKRADVQAAEENKEKAKDERRKRTQRRKAEAPDRENTSDRDAGGGSRRAAGPKGSNGSGKGVGTESGERESVDGRSAREQDGKQQESEQNAEEADKQKREDQDKEEQKKKDEEKTQKENAREKEEQEKKDDQEAEGKEEKKEQEESGKKDEEEQNKEDAKDSGDREEEEREAGKKEAESTAERERDGEGDKADEENRKQSAKTSGGIDRRDAEPGEKDRQGGRGKDDELAAEEDSEDDEPLGLEEDGEDEAAGLDDDVEKDDEDAEKSAWDTEIKPQDHLPEGDLDVSGVQTADRMAPGTASAGSPSAPERGGQDAARSATDSGKPAAADGKEPGAAQGVQGKHGVPSVPKPPPTKADAVEGARAEEDAEEGADGPAQQNEANAGADKDLQSGKTADQEVGPDPEAGADKEDDENGRSDGKNAAQDKDGDGDPGDADTKQERAEDRTRDAETRRAEEDSGKESGERSEGENSKDGSSEKLAKADEDKRGQATESGGSGKDSGEKQDGAKGTSQEGKSAEGSKDSDSSGGKADDSSAGKDPKSASEEKSTEDSGSKDPASSKGSSSAEKSGENSGEKAEDDGATKEVSAGKGQATEEDKAAGEESASAAAAPKVSEGAGAGSGAGGGAQGGGGIPAVSQAAGKSAAPQETAAPKADAPAPKEKPTPQAKKAAKAAKPAAKQAAPPAAAKSAPPKPSAPKADASKSASAKAAKGGGPAPKAPKGGGGGGPAPLKGKKDGPAPDVSNSTPEAGLASAGKLKPHQALQTIKGVDGAVNKSVGKERAALAKAPPKMERPSGSPKTLRGGPKPAAPGQYTNEKVAKTDAAKGKTPQINGEQRPKGELPESQAEEPSWWDIGGTLLKEIIKRILPGKVADSIDSLKTTDDGLQGARVGDAPRLPTDADADPERTDKQQKKLDDKSQELQKSGREDAARPMGEDQIYPDVPKETLEAKVDGAKGGGDKGAKGGGPRGGKAPGAGGGVTVEAVSAVAAHDRGPQIKRGFSQGQKQMSKERADKEKKAKEDKQRHEKNVQKEVSSNGKTQEDARNKGRSDVSGARDKWRKEQDDKTADIEGKKGKKYDKARKDIKEKKEDTDKKVDKRTEDDNKDIDKKRDNAEKEAENKRKDDKEKSGNWISQGIDWVKEQFNKLKKAIKGVFEKARNLVTGVINEFKKKVFEFIDKARDWVVKQINDFADALIALGDELLKNYPAMRDKWRNTIDGVRDAAVKKVNEAADALKKGVGKLLDGLGKVLTAGLDLLEKGLLAAVSVAETVVTKAMEYGGALLKGLGEWAQIASDIVTDPGGWISNAKASAESGARDHLFNEVKAAVKEWFNQKVQEIIGIPLETFNTLIKGGMSKEEMAKMAWDAAVPQLPLIIGELVITKVVAKLIPGAGWVMAIIDALQTAWGALSEILRAFGTFMEYLKAVKAGGAKAAIMFAKAVAAGVVALLELVYEALISGVGKYMGKVSKSLSGIAKSMRKKKPAPRANKPRSPRKKPVPRKRPARPEKEARPEKRPAPEKRPKPHEQRGRAKQEEKKDRREERREDGKDVNLARRRLRDANRKLRSRDGDDTPRRGVARDTLRRDRRRREDRDTTRPGTRNDSRRPTDNRPDARRPDRDQDRDRRPDANRRNEDRRRDDARNRPDADRRRDNDRDRPDADRRRDGDRRRETEGTKKKPRREGESRPGRALRRARQTVKSALGRARRAGRRLLGKGRDLGRKLTNNTRRMRDAYKRRRDLLKQQQQRRAEQRRQEKQQKREKTRKKENSQQSKAQRLEKILAKLRPRLAVMLRRGVPRPVMRAALIAMRAWYRLTGLSLEGSQAFRIIAILNPTGEAASGLMKRVRDILGPELLRILEEELQMPDAEQGWSRLQDRTSEDTFAGDLERMKRDIERELGEEPVLFRGDEVQRILAAKLKAQIRSRYGTPGFNQPLRGTENGPHPFTYRDPGLTQQGRNMRQNEAEATDIQPRRQRFKPVPGSDAHVGQSWQRYRTRQSRAGKAVRKFQDWYRQYVQNQGLTYKGEKYEQDFIEAQQLKKEDGWDWGDAREQSALENEMVTRTGEKRRPDLVHFDRKILFELKSTKKAKFNQTGKDEKLIKQGWRVIYVVGEPISNRKKKNLEKKGIVVVEWLADGSPVADSLPLF